ncbi:MAG: formate--tetrahydrofolate ligase [Candidatus Gracilibacteria bacterium]|nr:formate--tetrahydrofolate ligase [Candidatus Gracilibacteria bacterium]MDD3120490.1 formate--tetrahydrofolate ligase [Candidatus Gracilibacteria bacterium]MDD4530295.1 formate--tetrahydrofolate ligase [Candidatus Gracilibacteria bacterium]
MFSDIEISQNAKLQKIKEIASKIGITEDELELYGDYKAKIKDGVWEKVKNNPDGKLILVTAINPTPAGEGKTTTTIGLGQAMWKNGKKSLICLREPSLGPVMGLKGGATGGGYAQVVPMDDINLHFTGDIHAVTSAHLLLSAVIDNHVFQGNELEIDISRITWKRAADVNDRALRKMNYSPDGKNREGDTESSSEGRTRIESGFMITTASEIMSILCLASSMSDLKNRIANIIFAYSKSGKALKVKDLKIEGAMTTLLKDAIKPNLVQTLENTPCIIHGGPFANIAHGCNSIIATKLALKLSPYVITEAGFGSDLGAEKFFDIKCRIGGLKPNLVILVATVRSLKYNGGIVVADLKKENLEALASGICNLEKHIENMKKFNIPVMVCLNRFDSDTEAELDFVNNKCLALGVEFEIGEGFAKGGEGMLNLANKTVNIVDNDNSEFQFLYNEKAGIKEKIEKIAIDFYGGDGVNYEEGVSEYIAELEKNGFGNLPICMAKTQYSLTDNPKILGRPTGFKINIKEIKLSAGAGFLVVISGDIMTMPGLPKEPNALKIDIFEDGRIVELS